MTLTLLKPTPTALNAPTVHRFPNGLTIVAEQLPVDAVNLNVWLNVGSAIESDAINGMAHFLEHMVFKGTPNLQNGEFERLVEQRGAVMNAATSQDYTHYYITTAPQDFAYLAPFQLDVVVNPSIPDAAFERERFVVLEEIRRSEDNPQRRTYQRSMEMAFDQLPYRRAVLGPTDVIEQLTPEQMRQFHQCRYQPSAMTAVAVGNLPVDELIEIVSTAFEQVWSEHHKTPAIETRHHALPPSIEPPFTEIVRHEFVDPSLQQARLVIAWRVPGLDQLQQTYALDILASILGQGRTSRLVQDLREERHLVSGISVSNITQKLGGVFYISARLAAEKLPEAEVAIIENIRKLHTELVTEAEMSRIRTQVANRFIFGNETPSDRAGLYGYYQSMLGDLAPALQYPSRIQSLHAEDLREAALNYLSPDAYGVVAIKPSET